MGCKYPDIAVSPSELRFEAQEGFKFVTPSQYVYISKATSGLDATWTASAEGSWLSIGPMEGRVPGRVRVNCTTRDFAPGTYVGAVVIESMVPVDIPRVPVILTVDPKAPDTSQPAPEKPAPVPDSIPQEYEFPEEPIEPPDEVMDEYPENPDNWLWQFIVWILGKFGVNIGHG